MYLLIMDTDSGLLMLKRGGNVQSKDANIFSRYPAWLPTASLKNCSLLKMFKKFNSMKGKLKMGCSAL